MSLSADVTDVLCTARLYGNLFIKQYAKRRLFLSYTLLCSNQLPLRSGTTFFFPFPLHFLLLHWNLHRILLLLDSFTLYTRFRLHLQVGHSTDLARSPISWQNFKVESSSISWRDRRNKLKPLSFPVFFRICLLGLLVLHPAMLSDAADVDDLFNKSSFKSSFGLLASGNIVENNESLVPSFLLTPHQKCRPLLECCPRENIDRIQVADAYVAV